MLPIVNVVAAIIVDAEGRVFATQRGYGDMKGYWEFPGGKTEVGETSEDALRREIREELRVEIQVGKRLTTVEWDYARFHLSMECFVCTIVDGELTLTEHADARWLKPNELESVVWLPADIQILPLLKGL